MNTVASNHGTTSGRRERPITEARMGGLLSFISKPWDHLKFWVSYTFIRLLNPTDRILGMPVRLVVVEKEQENAANQLRVALSIIRECHPDMFTRVLRYLREIVVLPAGITEYRPQIRACVLPIRRVKQLDAHKLALVIAHEATHGRLHSLGGIRDAEPALRERVERICISQEISLARRIPHRDDLIEHARKKLETRGWEDEVIEARRRSELERLQARNNR